MANANQTQNQNLNRAKLTATIVKMSEKDVGYSFKGTYIGRTERPWVDQATGSEKLIGQLGFNALDSKTLKPTGERVVIFEDAGLKNALASAFVKEGQAIEIVKLPQAQLSGGRRVNQYDIFALDNAL